MSWLCTVICPFQRALADLYTVYMVMYMYRGQLLTCVQWLPVHMAVSFIYMIYKVIYLYSGQLLTCARLDYL